MIHHRKAHLLSPVRFSLRSIGISAPGVKQKISLSPRLTQFVQCFAFNRRAAARPPAWASAAARREDTAGANSLARREPPPRAPPSTDGEAFPAPEAPGPPAPAR